MPHQFLAAIVAAFATMSNAAPDITSLVPVGGIAAISLPTGLAEYYYQTLNGSIAVDVVSGLFGSSGSTTTVTAATVFQVPPDEAGWGTPIAASSSSTNGDEFEDVRPCASTLSIILIHFKGSRLFFLT